MIEPKAKPAMNINSKNFILPPEIMTRIAKIVKDYNKAREKALTET